VKNTSQRAGDEVAQLYIRDVLASIARPVMELKAFTRIANLKPGEQRDVSFTLGPNELRMLNGRHEVGRGAGRLPHHGRGFVEGHQAARAADCKVTYVEHETKPFEA
jgi:hypothetical protein